MNCISFLALWTLAEKQCIVNNKSLNSIGFNQNKNTLVIVCENHTFNMIDFFNKNSKECLNLEFNKRK
jgi:hypothetical protein